jgi:thiamine-monophosphate kinase
VRTVGDVGEFGLIDRLVPLLAGAGPEGAPPPLLGPGDDAAAWEQPAAVLVASTDTLVEGIHFDLSLPRSPSDAGELTPWEDLGWKALAVNLSDLAAMGAEPACALVSLALRPETPVAGVEALYRGMASLAHRAGCRILGGDTVGARHEHVIGITVVGTVPAGEGGTLLRRDRGRPGDRLAVTGVLGTSAAGLFALQHPGSASSEAEAALARAHLRPEPQLEAGRCLRRAGVRCAMDVSDGLLADTAKLCAASGVGARVEATRLPLDPVVRAAYPERALEWAAGGGEDYQLLFAAPSEVMARARLRLAAAGVPATEIGGLTDRPGEVCLVDAVGRDVTPPTSGWDHFARPAGHP